MGQPGRCDFSGRRSYLEAVEVVSSVIEIALILGGGSDHLHGLH